MSWKNPPFRNEFKALDEKLWTKLGTLLDARQLRPAKQSNGLREVDSNLFNWGIATYSIKIRNLGNSYKVDVKIDGGWRGPNGTSSSAVEQLPGKYRRLLPE